MSAASRVDNLIYGMALTNHMTYFKPCWADGSPCGKVFAYPLGMLEHLAYLLCKIVTAVAFILISIVLAFHYLMHFCENTSNEVATKRLIRMQVSGLVLGESLAGIFVDFVGFFCPPAGYTAHTFLRQQVTRRSFERWGIIEYSTSEEAFANINFFARI